MGQVQYARLEMSDGSRYAAAPPGAAGRHIAQGERHIAEQEQRIARLARLGADTTEAQNLLNNFFANQTQHIQHRAHPKGEAGRWPVSGLAQVAKCSG